MTTTYDIARQIVSKTGGNPGNTAIVRAVAIWITFESGTRILGNNPLNMRPTSYPSGVRPCGVDGKNFIKFCSLDDATSTIAFQLNKHDYRGFGQIGDAIKRGDAMGMLVAVAKSRWSSDNYGGGGKLFNAFRSGTNYNRTLTFGDRAGGSGGSTSGGSGSSGDNATNAIFTFGLSLAEQLAKLGIPNTPDHVLTEAEATKWASNVANTLGGPDKAALQKELHDLVVNKTVADATKALEGTGVGSGTDPITALANALTDVGLTLVVVIIGIVFIAGAILVFVFGNKKEAAA